MKFRTEINITDAPQKLSPERPVLLTGSCFSDNIGERMLSCGWDAIVNPCGVIYNPVSMAILYQLALTHRPLRIQIVSDSITEREGQYVSWLMSSKAMAPTPEDCIAKVMECLDRVEEGCEKAGAIILTFGTSDVWLLAETDRAVGNCHKHPAAEFVKRRVSIREIKETWESIFAAIRERNPEAQFILTVSPRRYLADGFEENTRQKAVLILACEELSRLKNVSYFPAYEALNDDLRDYRFYEKDLLHPSSMAVEYIWEKFLDCYVDEEGRRELEKRAKEIRKARHREIRK